MANREQILSLFMTKEILFEQKRNRKINIFHSELYSHFLSVRPMVGSNYVVIKTFGGNKSLLAFGTLEVILS